MAKKFLRRTWTRFSKLGKGRNKKQKWKKPTGRHNKMREKRKGYPAVVAVGYGTDKKQKGKIDGKTPVLIRNVSDLENINNHEIAIVGRIGRKKKIEIAKKAQEKKIEILNLNVGKFLKKTKEQNKK